MGVIRKVDRLVSRVEGFAVTAILSLMIGMACFQMALRNILNSGIPWADIFLRNLVLWICFIGASLATREQNHISIDILGRTLSPRLRRVSNLFVNLASSSVCLFLTSAAWRFMIDEKNYGGFLFGEVPTWYFLTVLPVSLAIMSARFFLNAIDSLIRPREEP